MNDRSTCQTLVLHSQTLSHVQGLITCSIGTYTASDKALHMKKGLATQDYSNIPAAQMTGIILWL